MKWNNFCTLPEYDMCVHEVHLQVSISTGTFLHTTGVGQWFGQDSRSLGCYLSVGTWTSLSAAVLWTEPVCQDRRVGATHTWNLVLSHSCILVWSLNIRSNSKGMPQTNLCSSSTTAINPSCSWSSLGMMRSMTMCSLTLATATLAAPWSATDPCVHTTHR